MQNMLRIAPRDDFGPGAIDGDTAFVEFANCIYFKQERSFAASVLLQINVLGDLVEMVVYYRYRARCNLDITRNDREELNANML